MSLNLGRRLEEKQVMIVMSGQKQKQKPKQVTNPFLKYIQFNLEANARLIIGLHFFYNFLTHVSM
jgi:hypothetical protein